MAIKFGPQSGQTDIAFAPPLSQLKTERPEFAHCEQIWTDVLEPELRRRESERSTVVETAKRKTFLMAGLAGLLAIVLLVMTSLPFPLVIFLSVAAGALGTAAIAAFDWIRVFSIKSDTKHLILNAACAPFGFTYQTLHPDLDAAMDWKSLGQLVEVQTKQQNNGFGKKIGFSWGDSKGADGPPTPAYYALNDYELLQDHNDVKFEDLIEGERAGARFSLVEAKMDDTSGENTKTVFQGLFFHIEYPERFLGRTVITRSNWRWSWFDRGIKDLKPVKLVATELDDAFKVYSDDQVEARALLTPDRMERLIALERHFRGGELRAVFEDGHMTVALKAPDQFEAGSVFKTLINPNRFSSALVELGLVCDIIDGWLTRDWVKDKL